MQILISGGAGYIGSHTAIELMGAGHKIVIADNFCNSSPEVINRLKKITGQDVPYEKVDLCDLEALQSVFKKYSFDGVIHFAGLKAVGESVELPLKYYRNNIVSTLNLCSLMQHFGVAQLVFSSSATVYGEPETVPISEDAPLHATNPYGQTKLIIEQILRDFVVSDKNLRITCLRYFNPIGAHDSGLIGEDPNGIPNNLLPYVSQVAVGKLPKLRVFGNDYPTPDGTGVRDYIHVTDLAQGHLAALIHMPPPGSWAAYNLGTGRGYSVLEVIKEFEKACGKPIAYEVVPRRPGDIPACYADPSRAEQDLGWKAMKTLEQACQDVWRWQSANPNGYKPA